jgi:hypothetical protein
MSEKTLKLCNDELELSISGYEKYSKVEDDSWADVAWKVNNDVIKFENYSYDMLSYEVEGLKDKFKKFINGEIQEYTCFVPIESAFKIRFYPKGDEYGMYYEDVEKGKLVESKNVEIIVHPNENTGAFDEMVGASFILDEEDVQKLYDYLEKITN